MFNVFVALESKVLFDKIVCLENERGHRMENRFYLDFVELGEVVHGHVSVMTTTHGCIPWLYMECTYNCVI